MPTNYEKAFYKDYEQLYHQNKKMAAELRSLQYNYNLMESTSIKLEKQKQELIKVLLRLQQMELVHATLILKSKLLIKFLQTRAMEICGVMRD